MKQIFDMAVAEGQIERNPALLLFTPKDAAKPVRSPLHDVFTWDNGEAAAQYRLDQARGLAAGIASRVDRHQLPPVR